MRRRSNQSGVFFGVPSMINSSRVKALYQPDGGKRVAKRKAADREIGCERSVQQTRPSLRPCQPRFQLFAKPLNLLVGNLNLPVNSDCEPAGAEVTKLDPVERHVVLNGGRMRCFEICAFL